MTFHAKADVQTSAAINEPREESSADTAGRHSGPNPLEQLLVSG
jgi:hypothetical protein